MLREPGFPLSLQLILDLFLVDAPLDSLEVAMRVRRQSLENAHNPIRQTLRLPYSLNGGGVQLTATLAKTIRFGATEVWHFFSDHPY